MNASHHVINLVKTDHNKTENVDPIFKIAEQYGLKKIQKSTAKSFSLAIFAGAFIAIAFVFYITVTTGANNTSWGLIRLTGGIAFSLGLILVVVCGGELFTSTVLSSIAWAQKLFSTKQLLTCWLRVYLGNFVGAALMVVLIVTARMHLLDGGEWGINALQIAQHKLEHSWLQAFSLGILCNLLVCLGIWMTFSCKTSAEKSMLLILPVAMFISSGFEHCIANMFMVPLGITIKAVSSPDFFISHGFTAADFSHLSWSNFIFHNLIPVTLGNIVGGGLLIGIGYWSIEKQPQNKNSFVNNNTKHITNSGETTVMKTTLEKLAVKDVMDKKPLILNQKDDIYHALSLLTMHEVAAAPIVDQKQQLVGFVSQQDILRLLWSEEYSAELTFQVTEAMQTEIVTVNENQSITSLLEFMVVDKEKLFPVNDYAMLTNRNYQSYNERLKSAAAVTPSIYPVVDEGKLSGVISRSQLAYLVVKANTPDDQAQVEAA